MRILAAIDPVTRLEGHLKVEITVDTVNGIQQVVDAKSVGTLFRGFESILINRDPRDAQHITERICGVCPVSHSLAAVMALEAAFPVTAPANGRMLRNLVMGANFVDSHILHFYILALLDYIKAPQMGPWGPAWEVDKRLSQAQSDALFANYVEAINMRRKAHEMGAIFGGRLPHPPAFVPGGITTVPKSAQITAFKAYLTELTTFIQNKYLPDVETLAAAYGDYSSIGKGLGNLLAFGVFDLDSAGASKLLKRGYVQSGATAVQAINLSLIKESVTSSWYADSTSNLNPSVGVTTPQYPKTNGYSWLKAPRYNGLPFEVGPLARMWVNGDYRRGISVMDRHRARAKETLKIAQAMQTWLSGIQLGQPAYTRNTVPVSGTGVGLTEAPRGALGHWMQIATSKISRYQIITPTCWNASPRDGSGRKGPLEQALVGTPVKDANQPIEVLRVIHSFDPCLDCAVHVMRPKSEAKIFTLGHVHDTCETQHSHE